MSYVRLHGRVAPHHKKGITKEAKAKKVSESDVLRAILEERYQKAGRKAV